MPTTRRLSCLVLLIVFSIVGCTNTKSPDSIANQQAATVALLVGGNVTRAALDRPQTWVDGEFYDGVVTPSKVQGQVGELYVTSEGFMGGASQIAAVAPGDRNYRGGRWHINRLKSNVSSHIYKYADDIGDLDLSHFESTGTYVHCPLLPRGYDGPEKTPLFVPEDYETIQAAVDIAINGDEIVVAPGTYYEAIVVPPITLTIRSASDDPNDTILDGSQNGNEGTLVDITGVGTETFTLRGFTFTKSHRRAVSVSNRSDTGHYVFENCRFIENGPWGALRCDAVSMEVSDCEFIDNKGYGLGAGILLMGNVRITRSLFRNNDAIPYQSITLTQGGAIHCINAGGREGSVLEVRNCTFEKNHCTDYGGAIQVQSNHRAFIQDNRFAGNSADACAGSIYIIGNGYPVLIERNLHVGEISRQAAAIGVHFAKNTIVRNNTIVDSKLGEGIRVVDSNNITVENNLIVSGDSYGFQSIRSTTTIRCNNAFGHGLGNYGSGAFDPSNISKDPMFCASPGEYELASDSPCLPDNNYCLELIGAFGEGCDAASALTTKRTGLSK